VKEDTAEDLLPDRAGAAIGVDGIVGAGVASRKIGKMDLTFGEFFCGAGGMALGATQARIIGSDGNPWALRPSWAIDADADAVETYRRNIHSGRSEAPVLSAMCAKST
jgi:hypothetical protein